MQVRPRRPLLALGAALGMALTLVVPASADEVISRVDRDGDVGEYTSIALDSRSYPVVSYYDATNTALKVLHCNDRLCRGDDESISSPNTGGDVGKFTSLALDSQGHPVVSYYREDTGDLRILHCNDPNCVGGDESISAPNTGGDVGQHTSLVLDASGFPVVSYYRADTGDLRVLHCNDANCVGSDESIETVDTGGDVGQFTSIALDGSGFPVVSYYRADTGDLKVLHCNDLNCAGGDESIEVVDTGGDVGRFSSLALDGSGRPVVSYYRADTGDLKLLHCNDKDCAGTGESITSPVTEGDAGSHSSLALTSGGQPMVSFNTDGAGSPDLGLLRCNDANCAGGDDLVNRPDSEGTVGYWTSLVLDGSGFPVISHHDQGNRNLRTMRCDDPTCGDGVGPIATVRRAPGQDANASDLPVKFTVKFDEAVTGFTASDVLVSGTAGAGTPTVKGSGGAYFVTFDRAGEGTIIIDVRDGAVTDAAGNPSTTTLVQNRVTLTLPDTFTDDDDSVFEADIERLARSGVTKGCNPPSNTRFCPDRPVTRGQLAAFLARALDLPKASENFTDVASSNVFAGDIGALAKSGITKGCNPPSNTRFCPDQVVTREQFAAFLNRALELPAGPENFSDVPNGSTFAKDIGALAKSGITKGCNPPSNTRFCPGASVTRGQLAAFFVRAGLA